MPPSPPPSIPTPVGAGEGRGGGKGMKIFWIWNLSLFTYITVLHPVNHVYIAILRWKLPILIYIRGVIIPLILCKRKMPCRAPSESYLEPLNPHRIGRGSRLGILFPCPFAALKCLILGIPPDLVSKYWFWFCFQRNEESRVRLLHWNQYKHLKTMGMDDKKPNNLQSFIF